MGRYSESNKEAKMKNHVIVGSRLLQTNKKWSHLKRGKQAWIFDVTKEEFAAYIAEYRYSPNKSGRDIILGKVCDRIDAREIWLPYGEIKTHVCKIIAKASRKYMNQVVPPTDSTTE
jgi:hypothetical protein